LIAAIWIVSPVAGLRPSRAGRRLTPNLPNPRIATPPSIRLPATPEHGDLDSRV